MNRCASRPIGRCFAFLLGLMAVLWTFHANAQSLTPSTTSRIPPIPDAALVAEFAVTLPPDVLLNQKPARLSPGARIHGPNNLVVLSATLSGQTYTVRYLLDPLGLVHEVWLLTPAEVASLNKP